MDDAGDAATGSSSSEGPSQLRSAFFQVANRVSSLLLSQQDAPESPAAEGGTPGSGYSQSGTEGGAVPSQLPMPPASLRQNFGVYNESLQEDLFLGKIDNRELQIKNTFLHVPVTSSMTESMEDVAGGNWRSAPSVLVEKAWRTKFPAMEAAHNRGQCKPCAYFLYKVDGCRNSDDCPYCHLCTRGEIKRRKKQKIKALKEAAKAEAANMENPEPDSDEEDRDDQWQ